MKRRDRTAYSLIELLAVIVVVSVLFALVTPAINEITSSRLLENAGLAIEGELTTARETALTRRLPIEVRFYEYNNGVRGLQNFALDDQGTYVALGKVVRLPTAVLMENRPKYSSLFQAGVCSLEASPQKSIPNQGTSYRQWSFRFLPNGQTDLGIPGGNSPNPFLTIRQETVDKPENGNFYTVQIDPINGRLRTYRP